MKGVIYIDVAHRFSKVSYEILNTQDQVIDGSNKLVKRNTISLKALPNGLYTVKVKSQNKVMIKKFLKL